MIEIILDEKSAEDVKAIFELRKMGISDEKIQEYYNKSKGVIPNEFYNQTTI